MAFGFECALVGFSFHQETSYAASLSSFSGIDANDDAIELMDDRLRERKVRGTKSGSSSSSSTTSSSASSSTSRRGMTRGRRSEVAVEWAMATAVGRGAVGV